MAKPIGRIERMAWAVLPLVLVWSLFALGYFALKYVERQPLEMVTYSGSIAKRNGYPSDFYRVAVRESRYKLSVTAVGDGAPHGKYTAIYAEYEGPPGMRREVRFEVTPVGTTENKTPDALSAQEYSYAESIVAQAVEELRTPENIRP